MRLNLQSLVILVVFAALLAATIASTRRSKHIERKLFSLRESHGILTQDSYGKSGDRTR